MLTKKEDFIMERLIVSSIILVIQATATDHVLKHKQRLYLSLSIILKRPVTVLCSTSDDK